MSKYLLISVAFLFIQKANSQNRYLDYKNAIKIYNLTTVESFTNSSKENPSLTAYSHNSTTEYFHPTIAYQWKSKKNNFHEIELTNFSLKSIKSEEGLINDTSGLKQITQRRKITGIFISLRYEYILNFNKSKDTRFIPSLGFGVRPFYRQNDVKPDVSSSFPSSEKNFGYSTYITPRLTYYVSSKFFIDINTPLCIFSMNYDSAFEDNPSIPKDNRTITTLDFEAFKNVLSARIGVGVKI